MFFTPCVCNPGLSVTFDFVDSRSCLEYSFFYLSFPDTAMLDFFFLSLRWCLLFPLKIRAPWNIVFNAFIVPSNLIFTHGFKYGSQIPSSDLVLSPPFQVYVYFLRDISSGCSQAPLLNVFKLNWFPSKSVSSHVFLISMNNTTVYPSD